MRNNNFWLPFIIIAGAMALFALVSAVSVDIYDGLFWARFIFALLAIPLCAVSILRALKKIGLPMILRSLCITTLYLIAAFAILAFIPYPALVVIFCILLNLCYGLFLFLDHGIMSKN